MRKESIPLTSIRGFAALWVASLHFQLGMADVGYSLWPGLSHYGYAGVDIFFILSGFIMAAVYRGLDWRNLGAFLTRRAFRIYPMHLAVLGGLLLLWIDAYLRFGVHNSAQQLGWLPVFASLLQPFVYHRLMWNAVAWSISVECVCYLLFPLAIMALRHARLFVLVPLILILGAIEHHLQIDRPLCLGRWGDRARPRGLRPRHGPQAGRRAVPRAGNSRDEPGGDPVGRGPRGRGGDRAGALYPALRGPADPLPLLRPGHRRARLARASLPLARQDLLLLLPDA